MNERIKELFGKSLDKAVPYTWHSLDHVEVEEVMQEFAKLLVSEVLDEVEQRAYYCGDRAWSDELDRPWIELEFGFGNLAELRDELE